MTTEFYDQRKWLEIHKEADNLIATKDGKILAALYRSPDERLREDYVGFVKMLREWAAALSSEGDKREAEPTSEALEIHIVANDPVARELIKRGIKWIDRLNERKNLIPYFFDNDTDPAPLARDMRRYLSQPAVPNIDTQRLDWLDRRDVKISCWNFDESFEVYDQDKVIGFGKTVREAIDKAMGVSSPEPIT